MKSVSSLQRGGVFAVALLFASTHSVVADSNPLRVSPNPQSLISGLSSAETLTPSALAFFEHVGIAVPAGEHAQFIVGDNIAGYYEGHTHAFRSADGYRMKNVSLLQGHAAFVDHQLLNRSKNAIRDVIQPHGHRAEYTHASEEMLMHAARYALSFRIRSETPAVLASMPLWAFTSAEYSIERAGRVVLMVPKRVADEAIPRYIALTADQPFTVVEATEAKLSGEDRTALQLTQNVIAPTLISAAATQQFTVHLAFGFSRDEAIDKARALASTDSWRAELIRRYERLTKSILWTSDADYNRALVWATASADSFVVEEFGKGIWAGLPWFRDNWGRDTFIALPGTLLATGHFDEAKAVLDNFARYQKRGELKDNEYGRIPNRVATGNSIIYNTVDGTPWLIRELMEYLRYSGDEAYAKQLLPLIREYIKGVQQHWLDENGLLTHDDADTWMDARIAGKEAWSPRGNRAVEIQALWFTALDVAAELSTRAGLISEAATYRAMAEKVQQRFPALFWNGERMADRLRADGSADFSLRPNQLMLISIPFSSFIPYEIQARVTRNAVSGLLYPYGIASLEQAHPDFHPKHENPTFHHKDAAYHNGTVWGWNAGFTVTALNKFGYQDLAWSLSQNLADQILNLGTRGSMSELLDALPDEQGKPKPSGTYSQAWSVSEFVRNAYQDYLGFRPDLLNNRLLFVPSLPSVWTTLDARLPYGKDETLELRLRHDGDSLSWYFTPKSARSREVVMDLLAHDRSRQRITFTLSSKPAELRWDGRDATLNGKAMVVSTVMASQTSVIGDLHFVTPRRYVPKDFPVLRGKDVLQNEILLQNRILPASD